MLHRLEPCGELAPCPTTSAEFRNTTPAEVLV
jgi:hypothetical protein